MSNTRNKRRWSSSTAVAVLTLAVAAAACEEGLVTGGGDDLLTVASLEITAADTDLAEGATSHFAAQARTSDGATVDDATITWASRDESVATVGASTGTVAAVMDGETYIVAETGEDEATFFDSVLVTVSMPEVNSVGHAQFRIRGDVTASHSWQADWEWIIAIEESLGPDGKTTGWLEVDHELSDGTDVGFYGVFPETSEFTTGTTQLASWDPTTLENESTFVDALGGPIALLFEERDDHDVFYANTSGTLTIEAIEGTPGYGYDQAADLFLYVEMTAEGYRWDWETGEITPTGETVQIRGRMGLSYFMERRGYTTMTLTGGTSIDVEGYASAWMTGEGGLYVQSGHYTDHADDSYTGLYVGSHLASPGTGTFTVDSIGEWDQPSDTNWASGDYYDYDGDTGEYTAQWDLMSYGGTISVSQYDGSGGIIEGTTTVTLGILDNDTYDYAGELQADIYFIAPVEGDSGGMSAFRAGEQDRSGLMSLLRGQGAPEGAERRQQ